MLQCSPSLLLQCWPSLPLLQCSPSLPLLQCSPCLLLQRSLSLPWLQEAQKSVSELVTYVCNTTARMPEAECEVLYGRAGLLYALLFVERMCPKAEISSRHFQKLIHDIVVEGKRCGEHLAARGVAVPSPAFMHLWHKKPYLGAAHGTCGILHVRSRLTSSLMSVEIQCPGFICAVSF